MNSRRHLRFLLISLLLFPLGAMAQRDTLVGQWINQTEVSGQWFLAYQASLRQPNNAFTLKRGYLTVKSRISPLLSVRFTQDITVDNEGSDAGNLELRLKYLYLKLQPQQEGFFGNSLLELGMVHRPWMDFEQGINTYRLQGRMFAEEADIINSADFGITFQHLIGGPINEEYQQRVNTKFPGRYGSFSLGLYNGGGYTAIEQNSNKTAEGRLSIRPLAGFLPGWQAGYSFALGKGNTEQAPDFYMHLVFTSWEQARFRLMGQYVHTRGNSGGTFVDNAGKALDYSGFSFFADVFLWPQTLSIMGRYDYFHATGQLPFQLENEVVGIAWHFMPRSKALLFVQRKKLPGHTREFAELALEIRF